MFQQQQNSFSCDTVPLIYVKAKVSMKKEKDT